MIVQHTSHIGRVRWKLSLSAEGRAFVGRVGKAAQGQQPRDCVEKDNTDSRQRDVAQPTHHKSGAAQ